MSVDVNAVRIPTIHPLTGASGNKGAKNDINASTMSSPIQNHSASPKDGFNHAEHISSNIDKVKSIMVNATHSAAESILIGGLSLFSQPAQLDAVTYSFDATIINQSKVDSAVALWNSGKNHENDNTNFIFNSLDNLFHSSLPVFNKQEIKNIDHFRTAVLHGAHVVVDDPDGSVLKNLINGRDGVSDRASSHYAYSGELARKSARHHEIPLGDGFGAFLCGKTPTGQTFFQFESHGINEAGHEDGYKKHSLSNKDYFLQSGVGDRVIFMSEKNHEKNPAYGAIFMLGLPTNRDENSIKKADYGVDYSNNSSLLENQKNKNSEYMIPPSETMTGSRTNSSPEISGNESEDKPNLSDPSKTEIETTMSGTQPDRDVNENSSVNPDKSDKQTTSDKRTTT